MSHTVKLSGTTFDKIGIKIIKTVSAKNIGTVAKNEFQSVMLNRISQHLAVCVKQESVSEEKEKVFIEERQLSFPNMVPGNLPKPRIISSNQLATWLDKGTSAHSITPKEYTIRTSKNGVAHATLKTLHWIGDAMGQGAHRWSKKPTFVKGITGKEFWNMRTVSECINKFISEKIKEAFTKAFIK